MDDFWENKNILQQTEIHQLDIVVSNIPQYYQQNSSIEQKQQISPYKNSQYRQEYQQQDLNKDSFNVNQDENKNTTQLLEQGQIQYQVSPSKFKFQQFSLQKSQPLQFQSLRQNNMLYSQSNGKSQENIKNKQINDINTLNGNQNINSNNKFNQRHSLQFNLGNQNDNMFRNYNNENLIPDNKRQIQSNLSQFNTEKHKIKINPDDRQSETNQRLKEQDKMFKDQEKQFKEQIHQDKIYYSLLAQQKIDNGQISYNNQENFKKNNLNQENQFWLQQQNKLGEQNQQQNFYQQEINRSMYQSQNINVNNTVQSQPRYKSPQQIRDQNKLQQSQFIRNGSNFQQGQIQNALNTSDQSIYSSNGQRRKKQIFEELPQVQNSTNNNNINNNNSRILNGSLRKRSGDYIEFQNQPQYFAQDIIIQKNDNANNNKIVQSNFMKSQPLNQNNLSKNFPELKNQKFQNQAFQQGIRKGSFQGPYSSKINNNQGNGLNNSYHSQVSSRRSSQIWQNQRINNTNLNGQLENSGLFQQFYDNQKLQNLLEQHRSIKNLIRLEKESQGNLENQILLFQKNKQQEIQQKEIQNKFNQRQEQLKNLNQPEKLSPFYQNQKNITDVNNSITSNLNNQNDLITDNGNVQNKSQKNNPVFLKLFATCIFFLMLGSILGKSKEI
ncbi:hypothetical protein PPERSA_10139 [Pseudocohnilembus persalinus]|uniref:Uncharacterized protein n=1 Tax=Pseudocohnilembus persalinus TaxID=266149 RepID=A0A0V0QZX3_PSEPJ|nr:hypothetical protein PPERSA_10139 [Pseudocohnilembus persalinus]|eukprot:KRX07855.1 hypothetical protein PPERSA_10139 [Pseudocohnilembus persalinus]